jgi:hypothetical protein
MRREIINLELFLFNGPSNQPLPGILYFSNTWISVLPQVKEFLVL